ncbi:MAG: PAS domain S-box protein [Candidatus Ozemobacteraceae bacterium]
MGTDNTARKKAEEALLKAGALQSAIFNSANFSSIATDEKGVIQIFNVGAERMLGYAAADVMNKITPADISDPQEVVARAKALSAELATPITPGFEALVFKASRGIEDIYELTYIRKDGSRFPAVVSVTALRDGHNAIIGYLLIGTDNTARKRAEEALLKAGALQSAIFNSANFSSIATDAKGVIQIFNVGAERMLGYAAADVMNKITPADISDPQEVVARAKALSAELSTQITPGFEALVFKASRGIEDIYELTYIRKDGSRFPAVVSVTALRDAQNAIIGYLLIGTDNTARKKAEEALLKAGALQSAIFNSANFSSIATDEKGVIQIFNVGAERMLGYAAADVMNKITPADISDPQEVVTRAEALSAELSTPITPGFEALVFKASRGIEDIYELTYIRKDGSRFPAVVSVTALRDNHNAIIGYLLIGTDNTARKQIEAEQKQLAQRLRDYQFYTRSLFECNIDALMTTDTSGIITDVNKQMEALSGCTRDELIGAPFKNYFTDPERAESSIKKVLSEKKITNFELTVRARDGMETVVSYNATTFFDRDRKLQGVFTAARDITERKRLDQVLQEKNVELEEAKRAADQASRAKSDFVANVSHEIRTPLNAIIGFADLAMKTGLDDKQTNYLRKIHLSGLILLGIINDILDFSKIEAGKLVMENIEFSLNDVVNTIVSMIAPQAASKNLDIIINVPFDIPKPLIGDPLRLGQVLTNLMNNAVKFTERGEIELNVSYRKLNKEATKGSDSSVELCIVVRDTGKGLSPDQQSRLFRPFTQADLSTTRKFGGTGLGLSISKRLVEMMGGKIIIDSEEGKGTSVSFTAVFHASSKTQEHNFIPYNLQNLDILVLETNPMMQVWFRKFFGQVPFNITVVGSTMAALDSVTTRSGAKPYGLLLVDSLGIEEDVLTFFHHLRKFPDPRNHPKIILVTAPSEESLREKVITLGVMEFLLRPITPSTVVNAMVNIFAPLDCQQPTVPVKFAEDHGLEGLNIFLVEDNPMNQQIARELLESAGISVRIANNGLEAVEALTREMELVSYDAILMDIQMPEMDGYEATRRIRLIEHYGSTPIIAMTAHAMAEEREKVSAAGMNDHISKPIIPKDLFQTLRCWTRSGSPKRSNSLVSGIVSRDDFPPIPGVNVLEGLSRLAGNSATYWRLLREFPTSQEGELQKIRQAISAKNLEKARTLVHTLKGLSGNLAISDLFQISIALEKALHENDWVASSRFFETLQETFHRFSQVIKLLNQTSKAYPSNSSELALKTMQLPRVRELLEELKPMLIDSNIQARHVLTELSAGFACPSDLVSDFMALEVAIGKFEFEQALQIFSSLENKLK